LQTLPDGLGAGAQRLLDLALLQSAPPRLGRWRNRAQVKFRLKPPHEILLPTIVITVRRNRASNRMNSRDNQVYMIVFSIVVPD